MSVCSHLHCVSKITSSGVEGKKEVGKIGCGERKKEEGRERGRGIKRGYNIFSYDVHVPTIHVLSLQYTHSLSLLKSCL